MEKVRWDVGRIEGCRGGWLGVRRVERGKRTLKRKTNAFRPVARAVRGIRSLFIDIRKGAPQSDCVMLFGYCYC